MKHNYFHFVKTLIFTVLMFNSIEYQLLAQKTKSLPVTPVGLDAYRMWDQWPTQRIGTRAYMRSTYDRAGGNESADASHFLFAGPENYNVSLDVKGKGVLYFFRANHWHGSPWHFVVDTVDNLVSESGTLDPVNAKKKITNAHFIPQEAFPQPLNWTWEITRGADLIWTPMPFEQSLRIAYSKTHYGTGYYIYHLYANDENLSQPIRSFQMNKAPDQEVLDLIGRAGTDIAPANIAAKRGTVSLNKEKVSIATINAKSSQIRALKFSIPMDKAIDLERIRLVVTWDNAKYPSVNAPLCLFFGAGTFYNRENHEYLVKGFPVNIRYDFPNHKVELGCYFPMPFFKSAKIELAGIQPTNEAIAYEIRYEPLKGDGRMSSYFHATYKDIPNPEPGNDMVYLDTKGVEGQQEWSGSFVGNSFIFSHNGFLGTLEADPRFFFDDSRSPQAQGTGTEEWGGGGDYWGGLNMTLPFAGHPCGAIKKEAAKNDKDLIESAYRFLLADLMPFGKRAVIQFEHGGENLSTEHYECVSYWYGNPKPTLVKTDDLDIGNLASERSHRYHSPEASAVETLSSRYELGINTFPKSVKGMSPEQTAAYAKLAGQDIFPESQMDGRHTRGSSEFSLRIDPANQGVMLRRTLDYRYPNQTAEVYVSTTGSGQPKWEKVGTWYLAGSNTCLFSNPGGENDARNLKVQTSNRRFRDDEFMIPARQTRGKSSITVKIKTIPNILLLAPGISFPVESEWSELSYQAYSFVLPGAGK